MVRSELTQEGKLETGLNLKAVTAKSKVSSLTITMLRPLYFAR